MKILHLDTNHELLINQLNTLGFTNHEDYTSTKQAIQAKIHQYDGFVIRSRFSIDQTFLDAAKNLKFIARVGAGLENIDCNYAAKKNITLIAAPEGNSNAVGEHSLGMLLSLFNKLNQAHQQIQAGKWLRETHRGIELEGKTVGLIGYGNMGKAFAKKLTGFNCKVLCYDLKSNIGDANAQQVDLKTLQDNIDVLSLHTPETPQTINMINHTFINQVKKPFWLINTARGKSVVTADLVAALKTGQILGAGLDVLEYEKASFETLFSTNLPEDFKYLIQAQNVLLTPHVAGWTQESKVKLAQTIVNKIKKHFVK